MYFWERLALQRGSHELVHGLFDVVDPGCHFLPFCGEGEGDHAAIGGGGSSFDDFCLDEAVDQATGAADLADEQFAEGDEGERLMVLQDAQDFGLRWGEVEGAQAVCKHAVAFALYGEYEIAYLFNWLHFDYLFSTLSIRAARRWADSGSWVGR